MPRNQFVTPEVKGAIVALGAAALLLSGCGKSHGGVMSGRGGPNEFEVGRAAPLVIPPDYSLQPPRPGAPRPVGNDTQGQTLDALFGPGQRAPAKSPAETNLINQAGGVGPGADARSTVGDPATLVVDKGALTRTIVAVPEGDGQTAKASVGG